MGCCGEHKKRMAKMGGKAVGKIAYLIRPDEPCVYCAEKHLSTAEEWANEFGYGPVNRQKIIGQLCAAEFHLVDENRELAEKVRSIRHLIQWRREKEVDWHPVLTTMDWLANAEAEKLGLVAAT